MRRVSTFVVPVFATLLALPLVSSGPLHAQQAGTTRTVYFSAVDKDGKPVTDLTPADLELKEGGKQYPAASVEPATDPMQVEIIDDDYGVGAFQAGIAQFLQKAFGHGEFGIITLSPQPTKVLDFSKDATAIQNAVMQIGQRARVDHPDSNQLAETISDVAKDFNKRNVQRPVILAMTLAGEHDPSDQNTQTVDPGDVLNAVRDSGASLNIVYVTGAMTGQIIGDGPKQSGGMVEEAGASTGVSTAVAAIADRLLSEEKVTYTLPAGVKPNEKFELKTKRNGVKIDAPTKISKN